jgi:hypothetical protein
VSAYLGAASLSHADDCSKVEGIEMVERSLKSLKIQRNSEQNISRLSLVWKDGQEEVLDFKTSREMTKKYLELVELVDAPPAHKPNLTNVTA